MKCGPLLAAINLVAATVLGAQDQRDSLIARAKEQFDPGKRIQLLVAALDPAYGPPRGVWGDGVQLLGQTLMDDGQDSAAAVWLRWAVRRFPALQPDTIQFPPTATSALMLARGFVNQTSSAGDTLTTTTWLWPVLGTSEGSGRIQIASTGLAVSVQASVQGVGLLRSGTSASVGPGSYVIDASAAGYDSVKVTREVLPGATTVLEFHLRQMPQLLPLSVQSHRKGLPTWVWVGAGAGGLWAILWNAWIKHAHS